MKCCWLHLLFCTSRIYRGAAGNKFSQLSTLTTAGRTLSVPFPYLFWPMKGPPCTRALVSRPVLVWVLLGTWCVQSAQLVPYSGTVPGHQVWTLPRVMFTFCAWTQMVLYLHLGYPICHCVHICSISLCQTPFWNECRRELWVCKELNYLGTYRNLHVETLCLP